MQLDRTPFQGRAYCLSVTDYGIGIDAENKERIFEKYYRGKTASSSVSGSGIGLFVAKKVSQIMDAALDWKSEYISQYNIPILARYMRLSKEEKQRVGLDEKQLQREYQRLESANLISEIVQAEYLNYSKDGYLEEIKHEMGEPTHKVIFSLLF